LPDYISPITANAPTVLQQLAINYARIVQIKFELYPDGLKIQRFYVSLFEM
jgi:hypothetical protein